MGLKSTGFTFYLCVAIAQSNAFAQYDKRHQLGHEERMTDQQRIQHVMRGNWSIHLCGGDGLKHVSTLVMAGLEKSTAVSLLEKLTIAERKLPVAQAKQFSMFQGVVKIDDPRHGGHSSSTRHDEHRR